MSVSVAQPPVVRKLFSVAAAQATGASTAFALPFADAYTFYLNVTSAGQTTFQTIFQTSIDGGTTYIGVPWKFAGVTTVTGVYVLNVGIGVGPGYEAGAFTVGEGALLDSSGSGATALALQAIVDPRFMKLGMTVSGTAPIADLYVMAWPRGSRTTGID